MARQEHLIEYEKETIKELEELGKIIGRSPNIYKEIRKLLGHVDGDTSIVRTRREPVRGEGLSKGDDSWETYVQDLLKELGGKRKKYELVEYAKKANPKLDPDLINNAISGKLSKLKLAGIIQADESESKTEGYDYYITDETGDMIPRK